MNKRDLSADVSICNAATAGEWTSFDTVRCEDSTFVAVYDRLTEEPSDLIAQCERIEDAEFIAEARTGWPHAIERALAAEAEVVRLQSFNQTLLQREGRLLTRIRELEADNERLRSVITEIHLTRHDKGEIDRE